LHNKENAFSKNFKNKIMETEIKKIMKKNYFILGIFLIIIALTMISCSNGTFIPPEEATQIQSSQTNKKIINTLQATAKCGRGSISVCYVMYEDSSVSVLKNNHVSNSYLPYTLEQAKLIMLAED
jgi:hypothetical protein